MITTKIKPMSVNKAWQGKRFMTSEYKAWREQISFMLPPVIDIPNGKMTLCVIFNVSSKLFDFDNGIKTFSDALQDKYGINDRDIYYAVIKKNIVPKGQESIDWCLEPYSQAYHDFMDVISNI